MAVTTPCRGCGAIVPCNDLDGTYSLQRQAVPIILMGPSGNNSTFSLVCCGQVITVDIPVNSSADQVAYLQAQLIAQCQRLVNGCPDPVTPPTTPPSTQISLTCCGNVITAPVPGDATPDERNAIAAALQAQCDAINANCGTGPQTPIVITVDGCCNQSLTATLPWGSTPSAIAAKVQELNDQCNGLIAACPPVTPPIVVPVLPPDVIPTPNPNAPNQAPPNPPVYWRNLAQTCCVPCADGFTFCYTTPQGRFAGPDRVRVNQLAHDEACTNAGKFKICLTSIPQYYCANVATGLITIGITGSYIDANDLWAITAGTLPPGLTFNPNGNQAVITGTPTTTGVFTFTVRMTVPSSGNFAERSYAISILGITTPSSLPPATQATAYSVQLTAGTAGSGHYQWMLYSGTLPGNLTIDANTGKISGSDPGTPGTHTFEIGLIDNGHSDINCHKSFSLTVAPGGTIPVPLRLYHGTDNTSAGSWHYGVNEWFPVRSSPVVYQSRTWVFKGALSGIGGPYSDTGLVVFLPVGVITLSLDILPETEPSPLTTATLNITPTTRLLGFDTRAEPGGFTGITYDNAHFEAASLPDFRLNVAYNASAGTFVTTLSPVVWSIISGALPDGLTLDSSTGVISGTPVAPATCKQYNFTIRVTDGVNTESCPFTLYCANQHYTVNGFITVPDHFNRWFDGVDYWLSPVGSKVISLQGEYQDDLFGGVMQSFVGPTILEHVIDISPASVGYTFLHLNAGGGGGTWMFAAAHNFGLRIPIVNGAAGTCSFKAATQFEDYVSMTPVGPASTSMDFVVFSDAIAIGPVGTYPMRIRSIEEFVNSVPIGTSHTCGDPSIGTLYVT